MTRRCELCEREHDGRFGQGKFCSLACSKRIGALRRWRGRGRIGSVDRHGRGGKARRAAATQHVAADDDAHSGLSGQRVRVKVRDVVHVGVLERYDWRLDRHRLRSARGTLWLRLRGAQLRFV
ncbi:hypothetical protein BWQ96_05675 [Gracilariopsis chorda]|uniref:Uncharacterized protein n=1 Tax=Gracilariopsis chorda TaxID=448386 RepID=A0A2V3IR61_9FLOR|nr:hypothetical protein BWQ96_05675 [Gracilariopsis chorda]|eukprot:PXF44598.1 hypothetical protein BWQ96_05675 [Gracilariopsis chorda]